jgi:chromosomal replication initiator protein
MQALASSVTQKRRDAVVFTVAAGDLDKGVQPTLFGSEDQPTRKGNCPVLDEARHCDLLMVEDLQHFGLALAETLVQVIDYVVARRRFVVLSANQGPSRLAHRGERFPARLTNRLAAGLVVALEPLGPASRMLLLQTLAQRRQLAVPTDWLQWLAKHLIGGARKLEGALVELEALQKSPARPTELCDVQLHFKEQTEAARVTLQKIVERVGSYYQIGPAALQSHCRHRHVLVPRQIGMYLARGLTKLSLEEIGGYFGGRDHSTVLHACQKIDKALNRDYGLAGAVRDIRAGLI